MKIEYDTFLNWTFFTWIIFLWWQTWYQRKRKTYNSNSLKGENCRSKEERIVNASSSQREVDGVRDILTRENNVWKSVPRWTFQKGGMYCGVQKVWDNEYLTCISLSKYSNNCKILLSFKRVVFYLNVLNCNLFLWCKAEFSASLIQSSVSHAQETFIIINVESNCAASYFWANHDTFFRTYWWMENWIEQHLLKIKIFVKYYCTAPF